MAELPQMPLATDAYLADTNHLDAQQHGAYLLLLMTAWRCRGRPQLPDDDKLLARCARVESRTWRRIKPVVMAFWTLGEDGFWTQKRQLEMRQIASRNVEKMRNISLARWRPKPLENKDTGDASAMLDGIQPKPKPINTPMVPKGTARRKGAEQGYGNPADPLYANFLESIWAKRWERPNNPPLPAFKAYARLSEADRAACAAAIGRCAEAVIGSASDPRYRPMLSTWINSRGWETEAAAPAPATDWPKRMAYFRTERDWPIGWGPRPGEPGCAVPREFLVAVAG